MNECNESDYNLDIIVLIFCMFVCNDNLVSMFNNDIIISDYARGKLNINVIARYDFRVIYNI